MPTVNRWDSYFFRVCGTVASNSRCFSRKIGALIVRDNRILATGYNGPAAGVGHCDARFDYDPDLEKRLKGDRPFHYDICPRKFLGASSGTLLELCPAGHAEANAITNAARMGVCTRDAKLYVICPIPCSNCLSAIINAGIAEVICTAFTLYDQTSRWIIRTSGLVVRNFEGTVYNADKNSPVYLG